SYANLFKDLEKKVDERTSELAEANKFKTLFFTNIAHEFRTPLTISKGLIKQLSDPMGSDKCKDELEKLSVIDRNITRLEGLINQIIDLTKADEHKLTTNPDWYNAEELVLHSVSSLKELAKSKYQKYQFNSLVHNLILFVDRLKIETIFNNLISNAIKYTPNGGEINIATYLSQESNIFSFKVEDTGNGIPNGEEDSIFTRFHRLHNGHDYEEGMGIGLEVSRTYARLLGGDVIVEKARKTGACFIFNLPLFPTNSRFEEVELTRAVVTNLSVNNKSIDEPIQTDSSGKSYSILLVEDNKDMARYISSILSSIGRIQHTFNGFEAIEKLKEFKPDIIITDLMMPQMDGAAFVKYLAENEEFLKLPVIVLTATALEDNKLHLLRIGVVDYITKPFNAESLLLKIRNLLYYYEKRKTMELVIKEDTSIIIENVADKAAQFVIKNLGNYNVSVESLADYFEISRRSFYRLLATETGMTPAEFIREIRLTKARDLITRNSKLKLNELANLVGYKSVANFTKLYEKRFGIHPGKEGVLN
ncbi:MAG: response regulator, partial [Melioribacteraceae bacterium]|nr:response regulator [Melioribacteraceae bacterium]